MLYLRPAGYILSGLEHVGAALTALQLAVGRRVRSPGTGERTRDRTTLATAGPFGGRLVLLTGQALVGFAVFHFINPKNYTVAELEQITRRYTSELIKKKSSRRRRAGDSPTPRG